MDEQPTETRPDGTPIYGPALPDWSKEKRGFPWALVLVPLGLALVLTGYVLGGGFAPQVSWQTLYGQRIQEGCLPQVLVVGVGKLADMDRLNDAATQATSGIAHTYADARDLDKHVVTVTGSLKQKNPGAEVVAYITLERCLGGP